jgi:hypothetical protein
MVLIFTAASYLILLTRHRTEIALAIGKEWRPMSPPGGTADPALH